MTVPDAWHWFVGTAGIHVRSFGGLRHGEFGDKVITADMPEFAVAESRLRFYEEARPDYFATAERRLPGISALLRAVSVAHTWLGEPDEHDEASVIALENAHDLTGSLLRKAKRKLATVRKSADNGRTNR
jgi:hypothetical protein